MAKMIYLFLINLLIITNCYAELHPESCARELLQYCEKVSGMENQFQCLSDLAEKNRSFIGEVCVGEIHHFRVHRDCGETIKKFCSKIIPGEGRIMKCLEENIEKASQKCRATWGSGNDSQMDCLKNQRCNIPVC